RCLHVEPDALAELRRLCETVRDDFTAQWNAALAALAPGVPPSRDAFALSGDVLLLNYPAELHPAERTAALPPHAFLGSAVRAEPPDPEVVQWLAVEDRPLVYVSLGSFLSVRSDLLARVSEALGGLDVRVALASGSAPREELGPVPDSWLVREVLPQVTLLRHAALAVTHGGNNSVTEALTAGVPLLVLPLSTDQFAGAAALEDAGLGEALDPNSAMPHELRDAVARLLAPPSPSRDRLDRLADSLIQHPGSSRARTALRTRE
ncbi:MAG TPA: nucleotide disphospho-sugar-binding domain-containing protein, partial [Humibacillus sp.]|nr:nucleotide disphospho-sugar-binding domain-containing protein [Humibacillus sp.]